MKLKIEHNEYESSLCFSQDVSVEQKRLAQLSGDSAVLSAILPKLIANTYTTGPATDIRAGVRRTLDGPLVVARCALRISALASKMFHENLVALLPDTEVELLKLWGAVFLLLNASKQSVSVQEAAMHLGWSVAEVQRCAELARKERLICLISGTKSAPGCCLKLKLGLDDLICNRLDELEDQLEVAGSQS